MLAPITDLDTHLATRSAWHTLSERVLAPARHAATGRIGLRAAPGGFTTPEFATPEFDRTTIAVDGDQLVVTGASGPQRHTVRTLGPAAAFVGLPTDTDTGVYTATTPSDPETPVIIDPAAAAALATWFAFGADVLGQWRTVHADEAPTETQLWPEHFDLATDLGPDDARRANYGASPGDGGHELPYLYVDPWSPSDDPFWNAGSYARLGYEDLVTVSDPVRAALEFFAAGHAVLLGAGSAKS